MVVIEIIMSKDSAFWMSADLTNAKRNTVGLLLRLCKTSTVQVSPV